MILEQGEMSKWYWSIDMILRFTLSKGIMLKQFIELNL